MDFIISFFMYREIPLPEKYASSPEVIRASTEYTVAWVHSSERCKLHLDCFSRFSTEIMVVFNRHTDRQTHTDDADLI